MQYVRACAWVCACALDDSFARSFNKSDCTNMTVTEVKTDSPWQCETWSSPGETTRERAAESTPWQKNQRGIALPMMLPPQPQCTLTAVLRWWVLAAWQNEAEPTWGNKRTAIHVSFRSFQRNGPKHTKCFFFSPPPFFFQSHCLCECVIWSIWINFILLFMNLLYKMNATDKDQCDERTKYKIKGSGWERGGGGKKYHL